MSIYTSSSYESVLNQFINLCLESTFQRREIWCLLLKDSSDLLYPNMVNILYILMGVYGIQKPAISWDWNTIYILLLRKVWLMERVNQYFKDRAKSFDDYYPCMQNECTLFHVYNRIQFFVSMYNNTTSRRIILLTNCRKEVNIS